MANQNDERVMNLKKQIEEKKQSLGKKKRFVPVTNCSLELDGLRYNLNVLGREQLITLLIRLNIHRLSAIDLGLLNEFSVSRYSVDDWMTDIRSKMEIIVQREEESRLQQLENQLHTLLSSDKKVELEIDSLEAMIKGNK